MVEVLRVILFSLFAALGVVGLSLVFFVLAYLLGALLLWLLSKAG